MKKIIKIKNAQHGMTGKYRITQTDSKTGKVLFVSDWIKNKIMLGTNTGVNLLLARMGNVLTYDIIITSAEIGTGTNAPTNGDTNLQTPVLTGISITSATVGVNTLSLSIFIPSGSLANNKYNEFALRCGTQMFARSLIVPAYVKGTNMDTTIQYVITGSN
jgi:hypothetical protein